jgi:hypothetical protein
MYSNTLTSISGDDLLIAPSYGNDLILEVSANNNIFFKKGRITKNFDNLISEVSFNSLTSQVEYILQEISGSSALNLITSGISNDLLIKSYEGQDIILEVSGNSEIIFKRGDISYNLDDLIGGGGSQSSDYATYNILDITGKIIFTDNSTNAQQNGGSSSNIILTSISGNIIPAVNNTFTLGDVSKNWSNAYITDISVSNINGQPYIASTKFLIDYSNSTFSPLGQDLSGETTSNYFGYSIALSEDGTIMGVTAPLNNGAGTIRGSARIYKYNDISWVQLGQDIDGETNNGYQTIIKLSQDGTIAAISSHLNSAGRGIVRIFKYTNDASWVQQGVDIYGSLENAVNGNEEFGYSISLSGNGKIIAIGAPKNDTSYNETGQVRVYSYIENDNSWNMIGTFNGFEFDSRTGRSVSLSSSGTILAISSPFPNNNSDFSQMPRVDIYELSNNIWSPKGPTIYGSYLGKISKFGDNIVLSSNGLILAINELYNPSNNNLGRVLVYNYNSTDNSWNKLGSDINIVIDSSNLDWNDPLIALSSDGTIMALGMAPVDSTDRGLVRLYKLVNSEWIKVGPDILGNTIEGFFGYGISLSGNGTVLAIGSPKENPNLTGFVRAYNVNYSYNSVLEYYQFTNVKANNIEVSGSIIPLVDQGSNLGSSLKRWSNAYITDLSVSNIDVSGRLNVAGATKLSNTLEISGNVTIGGPTLYVPSSFTIDPIGHGVNTGTVLINGNLVVQGLTTTINSSVVDISDKMLVLASNASNSLQADGAGFEISGAKVNLLYNNSSNTFRTSIGLTISGNVVPTSNSVGTLGESGKLWDIAYIRELSVTNFTNSIDGANITQGTISSTQIANGSILTVDISDHAITYEKIAANAVTNTRIANGAVTHAKLSSDCVQSHNIVDGTIMDVDISTNAAISGSKIANSSITFDKINQANNWTFSQLTSTSANIRDISATNIEVSGNIVPLRDLSSNLGSSLKRWRNVFADDLSVNKINGVAYGGSSGGGGSVITSYLYSDEFALYSPESTNSRAMEIVISGSRFKRNYYLVPFSAKIESVIVEQIGETTPVTYLIDIWVNNSRSSVDVPRFLLTKNNVTSITLSNTNNSSTLNYSQSVAYYITAVPTANLIMYYPFSYNTQNVADRTTFKSAISDINYTDDAASIKVGLASAAFGPKMSFTTEREIPFCGTGTENFGVTANSNGYTLICFWLNPRIVNSNTVEIMSSGYYFSPSNFNNKGWFMQLIGAEAVSYQDDTKIDGEGQTNLFGLQFYCLARAGSQDAAGIYNGNHEVYVTGPNTLQSYTWTHIALYITPYNVFLCYNGVMVARSAYGATAPYYYYVQIPNSRMMIHSGMRATGYSRTENEMWNGYISDLRVYNTTTDFMGADSLGTATGVTMSYLTPFQTANISTTKYLATNSGVLVADTTSFTETYVPDSGKIFVSIKETGANVSNLDERVSVKLLLSPAIRTGYYGTINIVTVGPLYYLLATGSWSTSSSGWYYSGSNIARTLPITDRLGTSASIFYIIADADTQNYIYNISGTDCTVTATYVQGWGTPIRASVVFNSTLVPGTTTTITIKARSVSIPLSTP